MAAATHSVAQAKSRAKTTSMATTPSPNAALAEPTGQIRLWPRFLRTVQVGIVFGGANSAVVVDIS